MKLTADIIEAFAGTFLSSRYDDAKPVPSFHREAWDLYCSDVKQAGIAAPRNHGKTTALTFTYGLAEILFRSSSYIVVISSTETAAAGFASNIYDELHSNQDLIAQFGPFVFETDSKIDIIVRQPDGRRFRISVRGAEQRIRGLMWNGMRPDLLICHAKGTPIYDHSLKEWMKVENHPTAKEREADLLRLKVAFSEEEEYDEVVSTEHYYLCRKSMNDIPVWMQARDIQLGYLIGDCDDKEIGRLLPRNAGTNQGAISQEETSGIQYSLQGTSQGKTLPKEKRMGTTEFSESSYIQSWLGGKEPYSRETIEVRTLSSQQGILRRQSEEILSRQQRVEESACETEESLSKISYSKMGQQEENKTTVSLSRLFGDDYRSYSTPELSPCLWSTLGTESSNNSTRGEHKQRESSLARYAGFIWRPVVAKGDAGKGIVVMIKTKSGFYKSKFGMSHNCDDM